MKTIKIGATWNKSKLAVGNGNQGWHKQEASGHLQRSKQRLNKSNEGPSVVLYIARHSRYVLPDRSKKACLTWQKWD